MRLVSSIAWAAGFLEGEGSFIMSRKTGDSLTVSAPQKDREPLDKLQSIFGGKINGPYKNLPCLNWTVHGSAAAGIMMTVYPFMSLRRRNKIAECLMIWKTRPVAHRDKNVCYRGHEFSLRKNGKRQGVARICMTCVNNNRRERMRKKREGVGAG